MAHNLRFLLPKNDIQALWCLAVLAWLLNYVFAVALFPLTDLDEGAYAGVTREMFVRGDWLSTYLNGEPWFEKPILMYWMQSLGVMIFGVNEWGFRLPSAVASGVWFFVIYRFVAKEVNNKTGLIAAIVTMTALGTTFIYKAAIPDPFLNLLITLTVFDLYRYWQAPSKITLYRIFIWMGLGVLTKGPVAIVLPSMAAAILYVFTGRFWDLVKAGLNPVGWVLLLSIVIPWHLYQYNLYGDDFVNDYFFKHNVGRFTSSLDGHAGNLFFYLFALFLLSFPFWRSLVASARSIFDSIRSRQLQPLPLLLLGWFFSVLLFFTFASTKLPHYLMYGMVPIFIFIAMALEKRPARVVEMMIVGVIFSMFVAALPFILEWLAPQQTDQFYENALSNASDAVDITFLLGIAIFLLAYLTLFKILKTAVILNLAFAVVVSAQVSWILMPTVLNYQQLPLKQAAIFAVENDIHPVMWGMNMPSFSVYAQRVTPKREPNAGEWVITKTHRIKHLPIEKTAFEDGGISLVQLSPQP